MYFRKCRKVCLQTFGSCEIPTHNKFPSYIYNERTSCRQLPRNLLLTCYEEVGDIANKSARKLRGSEQHHEEVMRNWSQWNLALIERKGLELILDSRQSAFM